METVLEILKYTIPALVVFLTAYLMVREKLNTDTKMQRIKLQMDNRKESLPLRLQAYERLAILLERMEFSNLGPRSNEPEYTVAILQRSMIENIKAEFEHNISQQIYVSAETWAAVCLAKDDTIKNINLVAASLDPKAPARELLVQLLQMSTRGASTCRRALAIIHNEVKSIF